MVTSCLENYERLLHMQSSGEVMRSRSRAHGKAVPGQAKVWLDTKPSLHGEGRKQHLSRATTSGFCTLALLLDDNKVIGRKIYYRS